MQEVSCSNMEFVTFTVLCSSKFRQLHGVHIAGGISRHVAPAYSKLQRWLPHDPLFVLLLVCWFPAVCSPIRASPVTWWCSRTTPCSRSSG